MKPFCVVENLLTVIVYEKNTVLISLDGKRTVAMNQSTLQLSFNKGQIVWNYIFLIVLFFVIILNNGLVLIASCSQRRLHSQLNIIILTSLSTAQLVGGLMAVLINIILVNDYQTDTGLKFASVVTTFCGVSSHLHLNLLCLDRYIALGHPSKYEHLHRGPVVILTVVIWCLSVLGSTLFLVDFKNYSIFVVVLFFVVPLLIDIFVYCVIYYTVCKGNQTTLFKKELRLTKAFGFMTLIFALLWLPYMIITILADHCNSCDISNSHWFLLVLYCQILSLCFSSFVYYQGSFDFRLAFKTIAKDLFCSLCKNQEQREDVGVQSPPTNVESAAPSKVDLNTSQVNLALFLDGVGEEHTQEPSPQAHSNGATTRNGKDDELVVPFDQTKYFGETDEHEERQRRISPPPLDMPDYEDINEEDIESWFNDIDIVPYDQTC